MKKQKEELDRWQPIRRGEIYCSPACGYNCTKASHELAQIRAERLAETLNRMAGGFSDWLPRVSENGKWNYYVSRNLAESHVRDECQMHEYLDSEGNPIRYWCSIIIAGKQFHDEGPTAEECLIKVMAQARQFYDTFQKSFAKFKAVI